MEEVSSEQHHINILLFSKRHDFMEAFPAVIASYGISLGVTNMAIRGYQDAYSVCSCSSL